MRRWLPLVLLGAACVGGISGMEEPVPGVGPAEGAPGARTPTPGAAGARTPTAGAAGVAPKGCTSSAPLPSLLRPLTSVQYFSVIRSVFPAARELPNPWPAFEEAAHFTGQATTLKLDRGAVETLQANAEAVAGPARAGFVAATPCLRALGTSEARTRCLRSAADPLLDKRWNGDIGERERAAKAAFLGGLVDRYGPDLGAESFIATVLMSPRLLFRSEIGARDAAGRVVLGARELAEALSFTVADRRPDTPLLAATADGELTAAEMSDHAARLLAASPGAGPERFVQELSEIDGLDHVSRIDAGKALPPDVRSALLAETREAMKRIARGAGDTVAELLTTPTVVATERTLALHGVDPAALPPAVGGFRTFTSPARPGLLQHPGLMMLLANERQTNPVRRGHFILDTFTCTPVPAPPENVPDLPPPNPARPMTVREQLETLHSRDACRGCHQVLDGAGLPFESYDHLGRARTTELGRPVVTTGRLQTGQPSLDGGVRDATDLLARLAASPEVRTCLTTHALTFAAGATVAAEPGSCVRAALSDVAARSGGNLLATLVNLLASETFRIRAP